MKTPLAAFAALIALAASSFAFAGATEAAHDTKQAFVEFSALVDGLQFAEENAPEAFDVAGYAVKAEAASYNLRPIAQPLSWCHSAPFERFHVARLRSATSMPRPMLC